MKEPGLTEGLSATDLIDKRIAELGDWRGRTLGRVRALIKQADPETVEEVKWRKPSNPMGVPVWSHDGIICTGETYKDKVKFTRRCFMVVNIACFLLLVLLALLVGTMFGIWVGFNPAGLSAAAYVEQQQNTIRSLNTLLPAMGAICILLATSLAVLSKDSPRSRYMFFGAVVLMLVAAVVTRFGNQPINSIVMSWSPQSPAANWVELRDLWWQWHVVRSVAGISAFVLTVLAILAASPQRS